jgi:hypothetical protein
MTLKKWLVTTVLTTLPFAGWGAESGFMDDYSMLERRDEFNRVYIAPVTRELLAEYDYGSVMVDQPEVFMSPDSQYKGAKPDHTKTLADTARLALIERLEDGGYAVVDQVGPGVVYVRWAISDLYLKKKKRNILSYTPIGFVVHTTARAAIRDLWRKIDIVELKIEAEFIDGANGNLLGAWVLERGTRKAKGRKQVLVSWEELDATMQTFGQRMRCHLDNSRVDESQQQDCSQILIEVET